MFIWLISAIYCFEELKSLEVLENCSIVMVNFASFYFHHFFILKLLVIFIQIKITEKTK